MARHRIHSLAFKKQVVQEYTAGSTLNGLAREHDLSRNLIRIWIAKCESGEFDPDVAAITVPSASRINTPSAWSKPQHDAVRRKGRTPSLSPRPSRSGLRGRSQDRLHRSGQPLGERLRRELQCPPQGRVAQWRDLLQPA